LDRTRAVDYRDERPTSTSPTSPRRRASRDWAAVGLGRYDNDGDLDCCFRTGAYANDGDGTFTDVTTAAGLDGVGSNGGVWADFDNDGDLDFSPWSAAWKLRSLFPQTTATGTFTDVPMRR
jgi:hypothetical protein